jgi:capsular polysaccharide transport system ATP-binding protein
MSVSWPLGFAGGFQGSLTGLDNARFIARIYGRDYRELRDFVEDFSELGAHLKQPTKTYSSGMRARLAFALSLAIEFDCYLIDEVIMVGTRASSANVTTNCSRNAVTARCSLHRMASILYVILRPRRHSG